MMQKAGVSEYSPLAQLLLVNSLTCGLEVCLAAGITFVPPLLLKAEVEEKFMTMVLGIGPILGLLVVNLIGSASDHWNSRFGRRRPFIWLLCFGVMLSLIIIPYANHLASLSGHRSAGMEVFLLIFGIGLLDSCGQVCFTPLEALLSDLFPEGEACRKAFSVYALTIGIGACVGYFLPSVDWSDSWLAQQLGGQEKCLFTFLFIIFSGCVCATFFVSEEVRVNVGHSDICLEPAGKAWTCIRTCQLSALPHRVWRMALALRSTCALVSRFRTFCCRIPVALWRLFVAQLCSWMGLMTFILFYTDFIGEGLYHGVPMAEPGTEARLRYDEGVRMGSLGLFLQSVTSIVISFSMDYLVKIFGTRFVYLFAVSCLPVAAIITCFSHNIILVTASAAMTGITFSVLQILPYTLTSLYHHNRQVFVPKYKDIAENEIKEKERKSGFVKEASNNNDVPLFSSHPPSLCVVPSCDNSVIIGEPPNTHNGICLDMAILDSACLLSQVVPSLIMGFIVHMTQTVTAYVASAAAFGLIAIYFANKVVFDKSDMAKFTTL
ncbi:solute carrier family 45 member 3 [Hyla sarda]|uniref:solute carrier family 45 member 3 n=1 Tax=Hyla sarda TaxID=327740 RepID=UPI0024C40E9A|nr:solute carrier family 45 member 3 [Hyla sarda]XP_056414013.1 solute carrier family 45 member 3 [Hyla sarda]XP_056414014.1 solute carrier family 45 member 3 [Hyla sarda]XP_056414015.1 solute carrier family 45 member 3 [Hyla sarda]XP_056414016.1 solute carrier family 45 member 3 [Hyla sarda]XP_056414018.1 solute carrier family 45 member 3 [Hyla sarda]XP_056414019.1 solute carrier family 45 member 3 [Hyla sarda]XP_056414020.1 solute carrier family 45 member 3 [Hyla sarda]XP_056414021.1 solu